MYVYIYMCVCVCVHTHSRYVKAYPLYISLYIHIYILQVRESIFKARICACPYRREGRSYSRPQENSYARAPQQAGLCFCACMHIHDFFVFERKVCAFVHACVCMCVYGVIYTCIHIHIYIHINVCIYILL